ncbi:MAG: response regulator [Alphaproteobacteria bacterium]|nr:MAG: response regulator [Alphaproteobacteria bacterium]
MILFFAGAVLAGICASTLYYHLYWPHHKAPRYINHLLNLSPLPQALVNSQGEIITINKAFEALFPEGAPRTMKDIGEELNSLERERFYAFLKTAYSEKVTIEDFSKDPDDAWVRLRIQPITGYGSLYAMTYEERSLNSNQRTPAEQEVIKLLFDRALTAILIMDSQGNVKTWNPSFESLAGEGLARNVSFASLLAEEETSEFESTLNGFWQKSYDRKEIDILFANRASPVSGYIQRLPTDNISLHIFDQSEQKNLQLRLLQSQKLHAMGQLAGGIAHDFNNLLTAMAGFCDLLLSRHSPGDQSFTDIMQIKQNTDRAANLVRQLLAFSRQQTLQPKVIDLGETLSELTALLQRLIGTSNDLKVHHGQGLGLVKIDHGYFEQVVINMVVNARDAMPKGGLIQIKTYNKIFNRRTIIGTEAIPQGSYVVLEVTDTGTGIDEENLSRIFDPFFSTKESGAGTGLGLSTVYGIVKQMDGFIGVETEVNIGTTFKVFLPRFIPNKAVNISRKTEEIEDRQKSLSGSGRILLVEDEKAVRLFATRALRDKGYDVVEAQDGREGINIFKNAVTLDQPFDIIVTDVVMPNMDGPSLAKEIQEISPKAAIIFISGYAETSFRDQLSHDESIHFLPKPFSLHDLAAKVKEVMAVIQRTPVDNKVIANFRPDIQS